MDGGDAYDPFSLEEADFEPYHSEEEDGDEGWPPAASGQEAATLRTDAELGGVECGIPGVGTKRKLDEVEGAHDPNGDERQKSTVTDDTGSSKTHRHLRTSKKSRLPITNDEKHLWKCIWGHVRAYMKKYIPRQKFESETEFETLSKRLTQQIYEKESKQGTSQIDNNKAMKIKIYVEGYFERRDIDLKRANKSTSSGAPEPSSTAEVT